MIVSRLRRLLQFRISPRPSEAPPVPVTRVLVVGKFPNPTFDYYFAARLSAPGMPPFQLLDIRNFDHRTVGADGAYVIIVRYVSNEVSQWIRDCRKSFAAVTLFVDDDIAAIITGSEARLAYRYRLLRDSIMPLRKIDGMIDELWVSTETLARRLSYAEPHVLPPAPNSAMLPAVSPSVEFEPGWERSVTLAYHATAIHVEEHKFLAPIIRKVMELRRNARFEVFADGRGAKMWRAFCSDRIVVKCPLPWEKYLEETQHRRIDIMVVPVAPSYVNEVRAETKRIDIARLNAAAVLSDCPAFQDAAQGEILLPYDESLWVRNLLALIDDPEARSRAAAATRRRVDLLASQSKVGIPWIMARSVR